MIPRVCVNCKNGVSITNDGQVLGTVCSATPQKIWKEPGDYCTAMFSMMETPLIVLPDEQRPEEGDDGEHSGQGA